ncbi:MAG: Stk1 family PASTA domain-containing Ser/Thr kinase, partial [Defluviitaleaceae bacterium]|nr:Stk1 family PASTA domain-containing Ser/Thr kinase [Defluviitaleaceae bacterium]
MILYAGQLIAHRYEIIEEIGSGGMSIVYRAKDNKLSRDVTFKVLREEHVENPDFIGRFATEARAIASLSHPKIVNVYDVGHEGDIHYIVMEYVRGSTLKDLIQKRAPFSNSVMLGVANQIATALKHAHSCGIVHRDIKPQNILVMPNGMVKVADFGIAVSAQASSRRRDDYDDEESTLGSVHYISPEQACNDPVDARSDLYSLGICMFEMMTGELPFDGDNAEDIALMHMERALPNMKRKNPQIDEFVRSIIIKLASKQPASRYQNAGELLIDIQDALENLVELGESDSERPTEEDYESDYRGYTVGAKAAARPKRKPGKNTKAKSKILTKGRNAMKERLVIFGAIASAVLIFALIISLLIVIFNNEPTYVQVPDIIETDQNDARSELESLGLVMNILHHEPSQEVNQGYILRMNYIAGGNVHVGTIVEVIVSSGPELIEVPDITKQSLQYAVRMIESLEINLQERSSEYNSEIPQNHIISQSPVAGEMVSPGTTIFVTISDGDEIIMATVPDLSGLRENEARQRLVEVGLRPGTVSSAESSSPVGIVIGQNMSPGRSVHENTAVNFVVSSGAVMYSPTPTPPTQMAEATPTPTPEPTP